MKKKSLFKQLGLIIEKTKKDNVSAIAGQSALFIFLSAIPFLLFFFSIIQYLPISMGMVSRALANILPNYMEPAVEQVIGEFYAKSLNVTIISIIAAVYLAAQGFHCISNGLNVINHVQENRSWFLLRLQAMWHTVLFLIDVLLVFSVLIYGRLFKLYLFRHFKYFPLIFQGLYKIRFILLFILLALYFAWAYIILPNRSKAKTGVLTFKNQLPGAVFCTIAWYILAVLISVYVADFNGFSIYGSLTKLAVIIIWLYFCMFVMMIGAEINYLYHQQINAFFAKHKLFGRKKRTANKN
ncbi:MAG: YihY/virulence factor BrkB family protein [Bacillota bacterium]